MRVEDGELVAVVLEEPELGRHLELEAVRRSGGVVAGLVHRWVFADARRLAGDRTLLAGLGAGALLVHVFAYGWPLGFPLPGAGALFFPFLAPIFVAVHATLGAASCVTSWRGRP